MAVKAEAKQSKGRTATKEARRLQLIEATIESIAIRGFSGTTLATVTKGAKLSHGIINFHFKSKEALYEETLGYLAQEHYDFWQSALKKSSPEPQTQLAAIVSTDFERTICSKKKLAVWFAFWGQAKYRPNYLDVHGKYDEHRSAEIEKLCDAIIKDGDYKHLASISTARRITAIIDGLWLHLLLYPKERSREEAANDLFSYLSEVFPKHYDRPACI